MKLYFEHIFLCMVIVLLTTFTSCQEEDFGFTQDEIRASVYDRNFIKEFGPISGNQCWDFSSYRYNYNNSLTRALQDDVSDVSKRYLIEDLGSTTDFDFNDIVVDVIRQDGHTVAYLKHLCGTIPFEVFIGGQSIGGVLPGRNGQENGNKNHLGGYDPASDPSTYGNFGSGAGVVVNNWDPVNDNISVNVSPVNAGSYTVSKIIDRESFKTVSFPNPGFVPRIIACNINDNYSQEGVPPKFSSLGTVLLYSSTKVIAGTQNNETIQLKFPDGVTAYDLVTQGKNKLTINFTVDRNFMITDVKNSNYVSFYSTKTNVNNGNSSLSIILQESDVVDAWKNNLFGSIHVLWEGNQNGHITITSVTIE